MHQPTALPLTEAPCTWERAPTSAVCLCPALHCPLPGFVYSEALCKPPWFLGLLLPLSSFHFSPFLFPLLSFLFFLLIGSSISWVLHPTCKRHCKKDLGRAPSLRTFLQLPNTLGLLQVPEKKGLVGSPFHTTVLVAMHTCRQQLCSSSYLLSLLLSLSFYSCSSCFFTVAHMVASRSGNCWRGSRSAKLLAQVNKEVSRDEVERGAGLSLLETCRGPKPALPALQPDVLHMAKVNQSAPFTPSLLYSSISKHLHFPNFTRHSATIISRSGFLPNSFNNIALSMLCVHMCKSVCVRAHTGLTQRADALSAFCPLKHFPSV